MKIKLILIIIVSILILKVIFLIGTKAQENSNDQFLLETVWGGTKRTSKYNPDNYSPGCHSTALAQIMYYHRLQPHGKKEYTTKKGHHINVNYDEHNFDWGLFVNYVNDSTPQNKVDELALYRFYLATVVEKNFGNGSYQKTFHKSQIKEHFNCKVKEKPGYKTFLLSRRKVRNIIVREINNLRPVYFHYTDFDGNGHSVVIDGYKKKNKDLFVHVNFGWGGKDNGWYKYEKDCFIPNQKLELIITIKPEKSLVENV